MRREEEETSGPTISIGELVAAVVGDFDWSIGRVWAQQGGGQYDIYTPSGGKQTPQLQPGITWELYIRWQCKNSQGGGIGGGWSAAVTFIATGVPSQYQRQSKRIDMEWAASFDQNFSWNMGAMPETNVTITRITFWATQDYRAAVPPESEW